LAAAGSLAPTRSEAVLDNKRAGKQPQGLGKLLLALGGCGREPEGRLAVWGSQGAAAARLVARAREMEERALNRRGASCIGGNVVVQFSTRPRHGKYGKVGAATCGRAETNGEWRCGRPTGGSGTRGTGLGLACVTPTLPQCRRRGPRTSSPSRASACPRAAAASRVTSHTWRGLDGCDPTVPV
jgi:hypothetical protein